MQIKIIFKSGRESTANIDGDLNEFIMGLLKVDFAVVGNGVINVKEIEQILFL